ncbi:MAG: hypothetical protein V3V20_08255, partial [Algisphaera sp.]
MSRTQATSRETLWVLLASLFVLALSVWGMFQGGFMPASQVPTGLLAGGVLVGFAALPVLMAVAAASWGYGGVLRANGPLRAAWGVAVWLGVNALVAWLGASGGWGLSTPAVLGNIVLGCGLWGFKAFRPRSQNITSAHLKKPSKEPFSLPWTVLLAMPGLAVLLVAAACPPGTMWRVEALGYDVTSYHLQIPREWIAAGGMVELEHNVYGYLPGLVEASYAALAVLQGFLFSASSTAGLMEPAVYVCQLFHAALAVLAAALVGALVTSMTGGRRVAGGLAAAFFLLTPWVQITGSLAYNEMAVLVFATAGLLIALKPHEDHDVWWHGAAQVGLLAGVATLAKPTAGYAVALPLGLCVMLRGMMAGGVMGPRGGGWRHGFATGVVVAGLGLATLTPFFVRNAIWTGNPVFPFATSVLGTGHWDTVQAERWNLAHGRGPANDRFAFDALWRQALGNAGYGAVGGQAVSSQSHEVARFSHEGGVPLLWLLAVAGGVMAWRRPSHAMTESSVAPHVSRFALRFTLITLGGFVIWQFAGWFAITHLQSRFLLPVAVPLAALSGLGFAAWSACGRRHAMAAGASAAFVALVLTGHTWAVAKSQTPLMRRSHVPIDAPASHVQMGWLVDGLAGPDAEVVSPVKAINQLPLGSRVMVVGNNQSLLYIRTPMVYASAFDPSPLTVFLKDAPDEKTLAKRLRHAG